MILLGYYNQAEFHFRKFFVWVYAEGWDKHLISRNFVVTFEFFDRFLRLD